jgi:hypothetical protein
MSLTDTQLVLLSSASQREDRLVALPPNLKGGAAKKVVDRLLSLGLVKEVAVKHDQPAGRADENERPVGLKITRAGLKALGFESVEADATHAEEVGPKKRSRKAAAKRSVRAARASDDGCRTPHVRRSPVCGRRATRLPRARTRAARRSTRSRTMLR